MQVLTVFLTTLQDEASKLGSMADDARKEAERKMQALQLDSTQLDQVRQHVHEHNFSCTLCCTI